jgi:hypothetical protein
MSDSKALAVVPKSMAEVQSMAEILSKSKLLPDALQGKAPDVVVQILAGQELGLAPMAAIRGVYIVQGKPVLSADTMVALVLGSGLAEFFSCIDETATSVTYETKRKGSPIPQRVTWSDEDSKAAGLNTKDTHRLYKRQMRRARCKALLARDVYPDVLAGCYDPEELHVSVDAPPGMPARHSDAIDAEVIETPTVVRSLLDDIDTAPSEDALKALAPSVRDQIPPQFKDEANKRYKARLVTLREATP